MTVSNNPATAACYGPSELDRLAAAYPAFWFSCETIGRHGTAVGPDFMPA